MNKDENQIPLCGDIVGYFSHIIPMAVLTIYTNEKRFFARHPSYATTPLGDNSQLILSELKKKPEYFELENMGKIHEDEYAYALSRQEVIVGNHTFIQRKLEEELTKNSRSARDLEMISIFLNSNPEEPLKDGIVL